MCLRVPAGLKKSDVSFSLSESGDIALSNSDDSGSKSERMLGRGREISMTESERSEQVNSWKDCLAKCTRFSLKGHTTVT